MYEKTIIFVIIKIEATQASVKSLAKKLLPLHLHFARGINYSLSSGPPPAALHALQLMCVHFSKHRFHNSKWTITARYFRSDVLN